MFTGQQSQGERGWECQVGDSNLRLRRTVWSIGHATPLPLLQQDLFNNQLTNTLPNQWSVLTGLETLRLDKNQFTVWPPMSQRSIAGTVRT